jgi:hypothetical protein
VIEDVTTELVKIIKGWKEGKGKGKVRERIVITYGTQISGG